MDKLSDQLEAQFSLDMLSHLNPTDRHDMAQILMGAYTVNAKGLQIGKELVENAVVYDDITAIRQAAGVVMEAAARNNLARVAGLLGCQYMRLTAINNQTEPIRRKHHYGTSSVHEAVGVNLALSDNRDLLFAPAEQVGNLRIYNRLILPGGVQPNTWIEATMVDKNMEPLVDIEVLPTTPARSHIQQRMI